MRRGTSRLTVVLTAAAALTTAAVSTPPAHATGAPRSAATVTAAQRGTPHHPPAAQFTRARVDNPWFPLKPGTRYIYRGHEDDKPSRDVVTATYRTKRIEGVLCRVVRDRLFLAGKLRERTSDFYAQTKTGTVWYFGENTAELNRQGQVVSREGSFQSGRDGAQAGIFMPAHARVGQTFQQENYPRHAEDKFRILSLSGHFTTALVSTRHGMLTREWTRLEPGVVDHKFYIRDIGNVGEKTIHGGNDFQQLVAMTHLPRSR
jgi:hypothetical protein